MSATVSTCCRQACLRHASGPLNHGATVGMNPDARRLPHYDPADVDEFNDRLDRHALHDREGLFVVVAVLDHRDRGVPPRGKGVRIHLVYVEKRGIISARRDELIYGSTRCTGKASNNDQPTTLTLLMMLCAWRLGTGVYRFQIQQWRRSTIEVYPEFC